MPTWSDSGTRLIESTDSNFKLWAASQTQLRDLAAHVARVLLRRSRPLKIRGRSAPQEGSSVGQKGTEISLAEGLDRQISFFFFVVAEPHTLVIPGLRNIALHRSRPCEGRDPYAVSLMLRVNADTLVAPSRYIRKRQGLWVPAFAGTTKNRHSGACEARNWNL
jgi:hypothetical protein